MEKLCCRLDQTFDHHRKIGFHIKINKGPAHKNVRSTKVHATFDIEMKFCFKGHYFVCVEILKTIRRGL